jgi:hypothetical protein
MLFYKSTLVESFKFLVLNFTVISLLTCPLSFVMICRMQIKKERRKETLLNVWGIVSTCGEVSNSTVLDIILTMMQRIMYGLSL